MLNRLNGFFSIKALAGAFKQEESLVLVWALYVKPSRRFVASSIGDAAVVVCLY